MLFIAAAAESIQLSHPDTSRAARASVSVALPTSLPHHPIFRFGSVLAKSSHYFWATSKIGIDGAAAQLFSSSDVKASAELPKEN